MQKSKNNKNNSATITRVFTIDFNNITGLKQADPLGRI